MKSCNLIYDPDKMDWVVCLNVLLYIFCDFLSSSSSSTSILLPLILLLIFYLYSSSPSASPPSPHPLLSPILAISYPCCLYSSPWCLSLFLHTGSYCVGQVTYSLYAEDQSPPVFPPLLLSKSSCFLSIYHAYKED